MKAPRILVALGLAVLTSACGDPDLEGDWFFCIDSGCTELDAEGVRFQSENLTEGSLSTGVVIRLEAPGQNLEPGEAYCEGPVVATFTLESTSLTVENEESVQVQTVRDNGDVMALRQGDNVLVTLIKRVERNISGPCS